MKIVIFKGGLGNQMFQYVFYQYLKTQTKETIYGFFGTKELSNHNGLEITKCFRDVILPSENLISRFIILIYKSKNRILKKDGNKNEFDLNDVVFDDYWHNLFFFTQKTTDLFNFKVSLSRKNDILLNKIKAKQTVSIHIRRGDYLVNNSLYGNICTEEYYKKSINLMIKNIENPTFIFFSDDMAWVKENFNIPNAEYIDWNTKEDAYIDMFLMSNCKHNIIANSTFSWWGAYLNRNSEKIVIAPSKWINLTYDKLNILPDNWIKL